MPPKAQASLYIVSKVSARICERLLDDTQTLRPRLHLLRLRKVPINLGALMIQELTLEIIGRILEIVGITCPVGHLIQQNRGGHLVPVNGQVPQDLAPIFQEMVIPAGVRRVVRIKRDPKTKKTAKDGSGGERLD